MSVIFRLRVSCHFVLCCYVAVLPISCRDDAVCCFLFLARFNQGCTYSKCSVESDIGKPKKVWLRVSDKRTPAGVRCRANHEVAAS